jgi:hypothetical protein
MGNKTSNSYSIDKLISEVNIKILLNIPSEEIKLMLENILSLFKEDNQYFTNYLKTERAEYNTISKSKNVNNNDNEEIESKSAKFCNLISFMIKMNFSKEYYMNYILILKIMKFLGI